jgi:hypothetical protein
MTVYIVIGGTRDFSGVESVFYKEEDALKLLADKAKELGAELEDHGERFNSVNEYWYMTEQDVE